MDATRGKRKVKKGWKERLLGYFKCKTTILKPCVKMSLIIFKASPRDLSLSSCSLSSLKVELK